MSDREELIRFFEPNLPAVMGDPDEDGNGFGQFDTIRATGLADAILASNWLTAHDAAIRAEERERVAVALGAVANQYRHAASNQGTSGEMFYRDAARIARTTEEGA